jgi:molybdate transport system substrate-binding protein
MKKLLCLLLCLAMVCALAACGGSSAPAAEDAGASAAPPAAASSAAASTTGTQSADAVELTVFAAASMTETLTAIAEQYKSVAPNVTLVFNFDSSGTLKTQIQEGAACDLFLSAGQKQMNQLDSADTTGDNEEHLDFVASDTRRDLLENKVTLCVSPGSDKGIDSFDTLAAALKDGEVLMAMGNSDVPVGQYTQKILAYYELDEPALANAGKITYGSNVKEVTTQVSEGSVDCGVIYCTDAYSAGLTVTD